MAAEPVVRILRNWDWPDLLRQTPGGTGVWDGVRFDETAAECDYAVILNHPRSRTEVHCPPDAVWTLLQEPPVGFRRVEHRGHGYDARVYTSDPGRSGARYLPSHPAVPWHVDRAFDELAAAAPPDKSRPLSWITSSLAHLPGHRSRLQFLERLCQRVDFDLFGRGLNPIADKWDGLAPYRYSLAVENFSGPNYWTERVADCFLSWTMPIYHGCTNLDDYFPRESFVAIDIDDPSAVEQVAEAIGSDRWARHRDAVAEARERVLRRHQFFPFITREIRTFEASGRPRPPRRSVTLHPWPDRRERMRRSIVHLGAGVLRTLRLR